MNLQEVKRRTQHQQSFNSFQSSVDFGRVLGAIESTLHPDDLWTPSGEVPGENAPNEHEHESTGNDAFPVALDRYFSGESSGTCAHY